MTPIDPALGAEQYCYLTTRGRVTGNPHEIEIWFGLEGDTLYMLAGGRDDSDWVRNLRVTPEVTVRIEDTTYRGRARVVSDPDEDARARDMLYEKYRMRDNDLESWRNTALPVAVELVEELA